MRSHRLGFSTTVTSVICPGEPGKLQRATVGQHLEPSLCHASGALARGNYERERQWQNRVARVERVQTQSVLQVIM